MSDAVSLVKSKLPMIPRILFALMMLNSGLNKFFSFMPMPEMTPEAGALMGAFNATGYMFPLIGGVEVIAGAMLLTKKYNALGAILMMPVTVNIALLHCTLDPAGCIMGCVLLGLNIWFLYQNKSRLSGVLA